MRLPTADLIGGEPEVRITGNRFNEKYLQRLVDHHLGAIPKATPASSSKTAATEEDEVQVIPTQAAAIRTPDASAIPAGALVISIAKAQQVLGVCRSTVNNLIRDKRLSAKKVGRSTKIKVASIYAVLGMPAES